MSAFAGLINAGASAAVSSAVGAVKGRRGREFAREQREYATNLSNTAYQRSFADMRAAGLNPILAHSPGGAGAQPIGGNVDFGGHPGPDMGPMLKAPTEMKMMAANTAAIKQNTSTSARRAKTDMMQGWKHEADADLADTHAELVRVQMYNEKLRSGPLAVEDAISQRWYAEGLATAGKAAKPVGAIASGYAAWRFGRKPKLPAGGGVLKPGHTLGKNVTGKTRRIPPKGRR